jgi:acetoin utilization deacetylase AcuC-like enzyme
MGFMLPAAARATITAMSTAFYTHRDCALHDMGPGHPESPARLAAIEAHLQATGLNARLDWREAPPVETSALLRAHGADHVHGLCGLLQELQERQDSLALDPDTIACPHTAAAVARAAGAAVAATNAVLDGEVDNAFCSVRPPGHHATRDRAMGFCFFNHVAVAARHALEVRGLQRVAIIDFDVHHGNGTEDIVAGDDRILMCSFFQHPLYPYSGAVPSAKNLLNVPVAPYTRGPAVRELVRQHWMPRLDAFAPQMLFLSAGFDAHRDDGLAQLGLVEADYAWITLELMAVAQRHCQGRLVSCLEGGYNLAALARSVAAHLRVLSRS